MQDSINNVSSVSNVTFPGNRMLVAVKIPRVFDCDRNTAQGLMDTSLSQLTSSLVEAVDTYVASGVQFVNHDAFPLTDMGQQKVSEGERTGPDKDVVLFWVQCPKRLMRAGIYGDAAHDLLREQMGLIRNRIMAAVRSYWTNAMKKKAKKAKDSVKESEAAMTA